MALFLYDDKAATAIQWGRLREAYAILDHAPDGAIELKHWACGTLACAAGYLAQTPRFNTYGLSLQGYFDGNPMAEDWRNLKRNGEPYARPIFKDEKGSVSNFTALACLFGMDESMAMALFGPRQHHHEVGGTDRQVWLARVETLFEVYNQELHDERTGV